MLKTVAQFNKCLQDAVKQFAAKVNVNEFDEKKLTRDNDHLNLFDVFIPVNTLANTIHTEMIGHCLNNAITPEYDPTTRRLYLKISNLIIIGIIEILTEWEYRIEINKDQFQHYYYNYDENDKEVSRYYGGCSNNEVIIKL